GQLRYADDLALPRMLHAKLLRSPHPHALIESIDIARAKGYPGVHLVLTGRDFPVSFGIMPVAQDEYPLAPEHVRYVGDPVAAVVAKDEQTASEALQLIEVKYKCLPTIATPEEGLAHPETRIRDYTDSGNIHRNQAFEFGDVEEALAKSDHVFEDVFFFEGNTHMPMEQHAALAASDGDGKFTLWSSTQNPHYLHRQLARALQVPAAHIRVIACDNGGGFGGKCDPANHEFVVSKAALILGRPVKICLTREEVFYLHRGRHPVLMKFRTGVTKEGKLTGMHLQTLLDGGAYGSHGPASTFYTGVLTPLTYELPRFKFDACRVFTNKPPGGHRGGQGYRHAPADAARWRRVRFPWPGEHVLHRRADAADLRTAALQVRCLPCIHQQAPRRSPRRAGLPACTCRRCSMAAGTVPMARRARSTPAC